VINLFKREEGINTRKRAMKGKGINYIRWGDKGKGKCGHDQNSKAKVTAPWLWKKTYALKKGRYQSSSKIRIC